MWGNVSGTIQDRGHQTQEQEEEGRTTTRTTITRHKGKEAKRNGSKPERCSSCVLWGGGAAPSPPCPPPALGNLCGVMFQAQYKTDDTRHKNKRRRRKNNNENNNNRAQRKRSETKRIKARALFFLCSLGGRRCALPPMPPTSLRKFMWGNVSGTIQDRRHQTQEQEEEGRTTTTNTTSTSSHAKT